MAHKIIAEPPRRGFDPSPIRAGHITDRPCTLVARTPHSPCICPLVPLLSQTRHPVELYGPEQPVYGHRANPTGLSTEVGFTQLTWSDLAVSRFRGFLRTLGGPRLCEPASSSIRHGGRARPSAPKWHSRRIRLCNAEDALLRVSRRPGYP